MPPAVSASTVVAGSTSTTSARPGADGQCPTARATMISSLGPTATLTVAEPRGEAAAEDEKDLVFRLVPMPDEVALELDEPDLEVLDVPHDFRVPRVREARERLCEVDLRRRGGAQGSMNGWPETRRDAALPPSHRFTVAPTSPKSPWWTRPAALRPSPYASSNAYSRE